MISALFLLLAFQDPVVYRSDVVLVHVDAEVRGQDNRVVADLTRGDFEITDGSFKPAVLSFWHEQEGVDVILLFDTSQSMRPVVERVAEAAHSALAELHTGDRVAVMAFDRKTDLIAGLTEDFAAAERSIREQVLRRSFPMGTGIQRALNDAGQYFLQQPRTQRRRAIIIITDDQGTSRQKGIEQTLWDADAVVLGVVIRPLGRHFNLVIGPPSAYAPRGIALSVEQTGGDIVSGLDAGDGLRQMLARLRERYSLYYGLPPGKPGEKRRIQVKLAREAAGRYPHAVVHARTGYVYPAR